MAARIKAGTGIGPSIIEGARGEFTVWVGSDKVAQKTDDDFPTDEEVVLAVRKRLAKS